MSSIESQGNESQKTDETLVSTICALSWSQGDLLPENLARRVLSEGDLKGGARGVVVSHDCDLAHHSFANEPHAEVLIILPVKADGRLTQAKNPRRFHLPCATPNGVVFFEALINRRLQIDRRLLAEGQPIKDGFDADVRDDLRQWLSKRYLRAAFPTEFDKRIASVQKKIAKALDTSEGKALSGIYMLIDPDTELSAGASYKVIIRGTMRAVVFEDAALVKKCESLIGKMAGLIDSCDGIDAVDHSVQSEARFSLDDVRNTKRWDADFLSSEDGEKPCAPVANALGSAGCDLAVQ